MRVRRVIDGRVSGGVERNEGRTQGCRSRGGLSGRRRRRCGNTRPILSTRPRRRPSYATAAAPHPHTVRGGTTARE
jgi:hypothetical protein